MDPKYDNTLLGILQNEGKIEQFLNVIFGFLMRRTDFYHIMTPDNKKLGFPPGVGLKMVTQVFENYQTFFEQYERSRQQAALASAAAEEHREQADRVSEELCTQNSSSEPNNIYNDSSIPPVGAEVVHPAVEPSGSAEKPSNQSKDEDEQPRVYQVDPDCYNGAVRDQYTWSQTIKDVDIKIQLPSSVRTGRDVKVLADRKRIRIYLKPPQSSQEDEQLYFDRELLWEILKDEVVWTLHPKESQIHLNLDKVQERWWEAAFEGEERINTRNIDCSRPMHELDDESQAKIHQLMYDEQQKRQGLLTSEQEKVQSVLAKAWDQEGSPFRGTKFDLSNVNIATSNS